MNRIFNTTETIEIKDEANQDEFVLKYTDNFYMAGETILRYVDSMADFKTETLRDFADMLASQFNIIKNDYFIMGFGAGVEIVKELS
ncbi:MAG: hypothetical protein LBS21_08030 [Clostridiales bacterium]|jgi:predicted esterase|nr:hypothetical protein [Clostridiales bacterium]